MNGAGRNDFYLSREHRARDKAWDLWLRVVGGLGVAGIVVLLVLPVL